MAALSRGALWALAAGCLLAAATGARGADCPAVAGLEPLLRPGHILLLGEIHGTREAPAFVAAVACHAAHAGLGVTVGLELPQEGQEALDAYLSSAGSDADRAALVASPFWARDYQDGRTSEAMLGLVESLRRLRGSGGRISVVQMDDPSSGAGRDRRMADALALAHVERPRDLIVALMGNVHNRMLPGAHWNPRYEPTGYLLRGDLPDADIVSLGMSHAGGSAWICQADSACGSVDLGGRDKGDGPAVLLSEAPDPAGFGGRFFVGTISASPPARDAR